MNWKRWHWLDDGLLPAGLAVLRACWLWPWLRLLQALLMPSTPQAVVPLPWLVGLPLAGVLTVRLLVPPPDPEAEGQKPDVPWRARMAAAVAGLLALLLLLWWQLYRADGPLWGTAWLAHLGDELIHWGAEAPAPVVLGMVGAYLWLRGTQDASRPIAHDDVWGTVVAGAALIVLYLLLTAGTALGTLVDMTRVVMTFFAVAMAMLALTSLKITVGLARALGNRRGSAARMPSLNRYWLISVGTVIALLLGLGLLLGWIIAPEQIAQVMAWGSTVLGYIGRAVGSVLLAIGYVIFVVLYHIFRLLSPLISRLLNLLGESELGDTLEEMVTPTPEPLMAEPAPIPDAYRWTGLFVAVALLLLAFALALRRMRAVASEEPDEVRESILSSDLLQEQLAGLLRNWLGRLRTGARAISPFLALDGEAETRRVIRQIYQQFLQRRRAEGLPRRPPQTPAEYQATLDASLGDANRPAAVITRHYIHARYAQDPPAGDAVAEVQAAWADLEQSAPGDQPAGQE
ncbi:DUF4129 domain-containing protein [Litorilinea aerophila]|uniref:DUF4129 domain-containing protein n=1 Tax=Litorilinea aerophila TaxID=1204385 RepID=A0A540VII6_9CHLR|nr:DUF4129 domain-containing protein [Litorilinea aerophila]MCC9076315.1 DUF4129 domain-containing protein [Litorilinea aerophila]